MFENSYEILEKMFMEELDNIDKISVQEIVEKIKKVNVYCLSNIKKIDLIYFAYYDLYFTQLKRLNCNIMDFDKNKVNANIAKIREFNTYAKLVEILIENKPIITTKSTDTETTNTKTTETLEPEKKRQKIEPSNKNMYENEWVNWICKNQGFIDKFEPRHFIFCLNNLELFK